jgi:hypothetical protein
VDKNVIIGELEAQRDRLTAAIEALSRSRRVKRANGRRHLSPAAKKRIGDAMRRRWAERKRKMKGGSAA